MYSSTARMLSYFCCSYFTLVFSSFTFAGLKPKREALYSCVNYDTSSEVYGAKIYASSFGQRKFYEIEVLYLDDYKEASLFKKVNLISKYGNRVQSYTTGNYRIKIDRVRADEDGHFWTFARIPDFDVHSQDWSCKDIYGLD